MARGGKAFGCENKSESSLTHGGGRQRLSPNKLGGSHPIQEVAELCVGRQAHAAVVQTAEGDRGRRLNRSRQRLEDEGRTKTENRTDPVQHSN